MGCNPFIVPSILIVVGVLFIVGGVIPWFLIPQELENRVIDLQVIDSTDHSEFDEWANPSSNPLVFSCSFWNITNPMEVRDAQATPIMELVGPYVYKRWQHRINVEFVKDGDEVLYHEWGEYIYYPNESIAGDPATDTVFTINGAYQSAINAAGVSEFQLGASLSVSLFWPTLVGALERDVPFGFIQSFWPGVIAQSWSTANLTIPPFTNLVTALSLPYSGNENVTILDSPLFRWNLTNITPQQVGNLLNSSIAGSLTSQDQSMWLPTSDQATLGGYVQYAITNFGLSPEDAQKFVTIRLNIPDETTLTFYGTQPDGSPEKTNFQLWFFVIQQAIALTTGNLPPNYSVDPPGDVGLDAYSLLGYRHFSGIDMPISYFGILQGFSIIEQDPSQAPSFANVKPEMSFWVQDVYNNTAPPGFAAPTDQNPEAIRVLFRAFANNATMSPAVLNNTFLDPRVVASCTGQNVGTCVLGVLLETFRTIDSQFSLASLDLATRQGAWLVVPPNSTFTPQETFVGVLDILLSGALSTVGWAPSYLEASQLSAYISQYIVGTVIRQNGFALGAGLILEITPQEWLFGRTDSLIALLSPERASVNGIWTDYTEQLASQYTDGTPKPRDRYTTGKADPEKARLQLTFEGNEDLSAYYNQPFPVAGSSLTFVGPYRLTEDKDPGLLLWVPNVVRELELRYERERDLRGVDLYRYKANTQYKSVVQSPVDQWNNPYDFVMDCRTYYTSNLTEIVFTFPGYTLVEETNIFNDRLIGVSPNEEEWTLFWDIEPITGIAFAARAPLQGSLSTVGEKFDLSSPNAVFNLWSAGTTKQTYFPLWAIVRSNEASEEDTTDFKDSVYAALNLRLGLLISLVVVGGLLIIVGTVLMISGCVKKSKGDMDDFELRT